MFVNLHLITSYPSSLLNRDQEGHAKVIDYGDALRTRVSSAAVKASWRSAEGDWSIGAAIERSERSRLAFVELVAKPLIEAGNDPHLVATAILPWVHAACGLSAAAKKAGGGIDPAAPLASLERRELVTIGKAEIAWLKGRAEAAIKGRRDAASVALAAEADVAQNAANMRAMAKGATMENVLFGRMTTGDMLARSEASISVADMISTHRHKSQSDFMAGIDTLTTPKDGAAGTIAHGQVNAATFYGYSIADIPLLVSNLTGCDRKDWRKNADAAARDLVRRWILTAFNAGPKARKSATAPFSKPGFVMVEIGASHQHNMAEAFIEAAPDGTVAAATSLLSSHIERWDDFYPQDGVTRLFASLDPKVKIPGAERLGVAALAEAAAAAAVPQAVVDLEERKKGRKKAA